MKNYAYHHTRLFLPSHCLLLGVSLVVVLTTFSLSHALVAKPCSLARRQKQIRVLSSSSSSSAAAAASNDLALGELDMIYGRRSSLVYDPVQERFVTAQPSHHHGDEQSNTSTSSSSSSTLSITSWKRWFHTKLLPRLTVAFLPAGTVTPNYYRFVRWRIIQRFINANIHVLGTQSLLLGLGIQAAGGSTTSTTTTNPVVLGAVSAALKWVLKDALGKVVRMLWANKMGTRFDSDAKRWRFRSAGIFAAGNALEIVTYLQPPAWFLVWATLANCCKQVSYLTNSSTRTSMYQSFGTRENIGDMTAKGEAQIALVDLVGIASGVVVSKYVVTSMPALLITFGVLQTLEIASVYQLLRSVHYRVLNFERMLRVIRSYCGGGDGTATIAPTNSSPATATGTRTTTTMTTTTTTVISGGAVPTPEACARHERIVLPAERCCRRILAYGSLGRAKLSPSEFQHLRDICGAERFLLVVGRNVKHPSSSRENCHIVLHKDATNEDIVHSTLALYLLRQQLLPKDDPDLRCSDCWSEITQALAQAKVLLPGLLRELDETGWVPPSESLFGRVAKRAEWALGGGGGGGTTNMADDG